MSSFAKTKCPKCGEIKLHYLISPDGVWGFFDSDTTKCSCGYNYSNERNCIMEILDKNDIKIPSL